MSTETPKSIVLTFESGEKLILNTHTFKTKSKGYFTSQKLELNGKKYQVNFQLVEIGSKPPEEKPTENPTGAKTEATS